MVWKCDSEICDVHQEHVGFGIIIIYCTCFVHSWLRLLVGVRGLQWPASNASYHLRCTLLLSYVRWLVASRSQSRHVSTRSHFSAASDQRRQFDVVSGVTTFHGRLDAHKATNLITLACKTDWSISEPAGTLHAATIPCLMVIRASLIWCIRSDSWRVNMQWKWLRATIVAVIVELQSSCMVVTVDRTHSGDDPHCTCRLHASLPNLTKASMSCPRGPTCIQQC